MNNSNTSRQVIYISNLIGISAENNTPAYSQPVKFYATVYDLTSKVKQEDYVGREKDYDIYISVPVGSDTSRINEDCVVWVNVVPNERHDNWDYIIERVGVATTDLPLYCNARKSPKTKLYISNDSRNLYYISVNYDKETNTITAQSNEYIDINENTLVWTKKPMNLTDTAGKIKFVSKTIAENGVKLYFERVDDKG